MTHTDAKLDDREWPARAIAAAKRAGVAAARSGDSENANCYSAACVALHEAWLSAYHEERQRMQPVRERPSEINPDYGMGF